MITRRYVTESEIRAAKQMDLLTYLQTYEPNELVPDGAGYRTRTHGSLKISNGKWNWFSRSIGGKTALDYLIHVRGMDFVAAVQQLCSAQPMPIPEKAPEIPEKKPFELPARYPDHERITQYLARRGISREVICRCVADGILYEADRYHNAVFVGRDENGIPRYAMQRATGESNFKMEVTGSDKRYSFSLIGSGDTLFVAESAIDALSLATMMQQAGKRWQSHHYLSLGGVSVCKQDDKLPLALHHYLTMHPEIRKVKLALDNDEAGHRAADSILKRLNDQYEATAIFPKAGKDFNEYLQRQGKKEQER